MKIIYKDGTVADVYKRQMPYPAQLQGPALPKSVSCYVLLLFRVAIAQVFNICSTLKMQGNVQLSYYHAALRCV